MIEELKLVVAVICCHLHSDKFLAGVAMWHEDVARHQAELAAMHGAGGNGCDDGNSHNCDGADNFFRHVSAPNAARRNFTWKNAAEICTHKKIIERW